MGFVQHVQETNVHEGHSQERPSNFVTHVIRGRSKWSLTGNDNIEVTSDTGHIEVKVTVNTWRDYTPYCTPVIMCVMNKTQVNTEADTVARKANESDTK